MDRSFEEYFKSCRLLSKPPHFSKKGWSLPLFHATLRFWKKTLLGFGKKMILFNEKATKKKKATEKGSSN